MTCATKRSNGSMPVVFSQRPKTLAPWTSQAAKYAQAPPRLYSCSTRVGGRQPALAAAEGRVGTYSKGGNLRRRRASARWLGNGFSLVVTRRGSGVGSHLETQAIPRLAAATRCEQRKIA